jgi:hypothetical protein
MQLSPSQILHSFATPWARPAISMKTARISVNKSPLHPACKCHQPAGLQRLATGLVFVRPILRRGNGIDLFQKSRSHDRFKLKGFDTALPESGQKSFV